MSYFVIGDCWRLHHAAAENSHSIDSPVRRSHSSIDFWLISDFFWNSKILSVRRLPHNSKLKTHHQMPLWHASPSRPMQSLTVKRFYYSCSKVLALSSVGHRSDLIRGKMFDYSCSLKKEIIYTSTSVLTNGWWIKESKHTTRISFYSCFLFLLYTFHCGPGKYPGVVEKNCPADNKALDHRREQKIIIT